MNDAQSFMIDAQCDDEYIIIDGDRDDILDFLTAYNDLDIDKAKADFDTYFVEPKQIKKSFTPEDALEKVNEFILSKGGFDDYDQIYIALHNAIHGIE